jgi:hypothetical protein
MKVEQKVLALLQAHSIAVIKVESCTTEMDAVVHVTDTVMVQCGDGYALVYKILDPKTNRMKMYPARMNLGTALLIDLKEALK